MSEQNSSTRIQTLITAHAVLHTVAHVLTVSTDIEDARRQIQQLLALVTEKAHEEHVPEAMLREAGREFLADLL